MSDCILRNSIRPLPGKVIKAVPLPGPDIKAGFGERDKTGEICRQKEILRKI